MPGLIGARYCCCAVPLVNAGIYLILAEQAVLGVATGVLAVGASNITGAAVPTFTVYIFAILCWLAAICQPAGFIGVMREKTTLFKWYAWLNIIFTSLALLCAVALIGVSAARHQTAVTACEADYFTATNATSSSANATLAQEGEALCSAFAWADIGFMGGLWVILLFVQLYFAIMAKSYSTAQVKDHKLYHSVYSENPEAFTMSILQSKRYNPGSVYSTMAPPAAPNADAWDARPSFESVHESAYGAGGRQGAHQRGFSNARASQFGDPRASQYGAGAAGDPRASQYQYPPEDSYENLHAHAYDPNGGNRQSRFDDAYAEGAHAYPNDAAAYQQGQHDYPSGYEQQTPTPNNYQHGQGAGGWDGYGAQHAHHAQNYPGH